MFGAPTRLPQQSAYTVAGTDILDIGTMSWTSITGYSVALLVVLLILLLFINYTLYPIFQLQPGGSGFIRIPFMQSQQQFWTPSSSPYTLADISNCKVNTNNISINWSMTVDISIMNPTLPVPRNSTPAFRLLFNRGGSDPTVTNDGTIRSVLTGHNVAIGLLKDTNDLYVSFTTDGTSGVGSSTPVEQGILLPNVPTQTPFRIGIIIMNNYVEVYMNGKLAQTKSLTTSIKSVANATTNFPFQGPTNTPNNQIARLGNLMIWTQVVSPSVIKYATPALMSQVPGLDSLSLSAGVGCVGETSDLGELYTIGLAGLGSIINQIPHSNV